MLQCGFVRSNFAFAMLAFPSTSASARRLRGSFP
jgi:hypothetical protein